MKHLPLLVGLVVAMLAPVAAYAMPSGGIAIDIGRLDCIRVAYVEPIDTPAFDIVTSDAMRDFGLVETIDHVPID